MCSYIWGFSPILLISALPVWNLTVPKVGALSIKLRFPLCRFRGGAWEPPDGREGVQ